MPIRDILRRNLGYKVISLVLAIVFWVWLTSQNNSSIFSKNIDTRQLVFYNQPSNIGIISPVPTITIRIDSSSQESSVKDLVAYVDLKDAVAGESTYDVQINAPQGIKVVEISPKTVTLKLDRLEDKIVKVQANVKGEPASGYEAGELLFTPSVVNVRGPASVLANLTSVTVDVEFTDLTESKSVVRPVYFTDNQNAGIFDANPYPTLQAFPDTVEVIMPVYAKGTASKTVPLRVATKGTPADGMEVRLVTPLPSQVQLVGKEEELKAVEYLNLGTVDISGITSTKTINVSLNSIVLPKGVSFSKGTKISVMVYVGAKAENEILKAIPVGIKNIPDGLTADNIQPIDVTVSGYPDILKALKQEDISCWIDAKGLKEGTYSDVLVLWEVPSGVTMVSIPKVQLVLKASTATSGDNKE
ncbi:MAG: hypothetical protein FNP40_06225 [Dehalobacter sp. 4CP]|uniref:CdaR family protein n=1 Tax=Dehalobacter sp. CP TaxID=2594474 RepID=UPI0013CB117B|nr:hypothetical protein [Dehalobacter sp. 4CP]